MFHKPHARSRDFLVLSLAGSHAGDDQLQDEQHATVPSIVDHYMQCPDTSQFKESSHDGTFVSHGSCSIGLQLGSELGITFRCHLFRLNCYPEAISTMYDLGVSVGARTVPGSGLSPELIHTSNSDGSKKSLLTP